MTEKDPLASRTVAPIGPPPSIAEAFDGERVTELRHSIAAYAQAAGLTNQRLDDFVLAANELITNAVRHGGGRGWLRLWRDHAAVYCEVSDTGAGISSERLVEWHRPPPDTVGGWGLWLARQLSDEMLVQTSEAGTTVRISVTTDAPGEPAIPVSDELPATN